MRLQNRHVLRPSCIPFIWLLSAVNVVRLMVLLLSMNPSSICPVNSCLSLLSFAVMRSTFLCILRSRCSGVSSVLGELYVGVRIVDVKKS